ncbi:MAG: GspE/PulE family protein, partial [Verrucomicrobiota bacterium]
MTSPVLQAAAEVGTQDPDQFRNALESAYLGNRSLVDEALDSGLVEETPFLQSLCRQLGLAWHDHVRPDSADTPQLRELCSAQIGIRHRFVPLRFVDQAEGQPPRVEMITYDPLSLAQRQAVRREVLLPVRWSMAPRRLVLEALQEFYGVGAEIFEELLHGREADEEEFHLQEVNILDADDDEDASVVKFVNQIVREALHQRASDIHVEPLEDNLRIRYRIDGQLRSAPVPDNIKALQQSLVSRIKIMAGLDIAEKRLPQDGRIGLQLDGKSLDVRVATIPSVAGESVSLRLLGQERFTIGRLNFEPTMESEIRKLLAEPNGIILVTGPTGSGKSTTLYSFLSELNQDESLRIVTVEDPVENKLDGAIQIAVKPEIDLTFAQALRSILRGDPNVIMVGEMRDQETADIAIRAALTGHLVFSTLHTNDAIGAITRLTDMGLEPFLIGASV